MATATERINLSDLAYAVLGAGDALIARARQLAEQSDELPENVTKRLNDAVEQLRDAIDDAVETAGKQAQKRASDAEQGFDHLSERGRLLIERLSSDSEVTDARGDVDQARQGVLGAITSIRKNATSALSKIKAAGTLTSDAGESVAEATVSASEKVGTTDITDLENMTKAELYELATARDLEGRSSMNKDQLVKALR